MSQPETLRVAPSGAAAPVRGRRWQDLRIRILSSLVLVPVALCCVWFGGLPWLVLLALCAAGLAWEWVRLCGGTTARPPGIGLPILLVLTVVLLAVGQGAVALVALAAGAGVLAPAARGRLARPALFALGVPYLGLAALSLLFLRQDPLVGRGNLVFLLLLIWASDIGAYAVGRWLGGPKLAPAISPGKTWSGAVGGLVAAMLVGVVAALLLGPRPSLLRPALVAGLLAALSQAGDLFESAVKRRAGVKDSSQLIPGHGGLLDRLDGVLAAAPAAALLGLLLGQGVPLWR